MSWCWLALREDRPTDAELCAQVCELDGSSAGFLAAWPATVDQPGGAAKVDGRALDPAGSTAELSLVLAPPGLALPFDDPAVAQAIRRVLALPPADFVSTLLLGDSRFVGAVTGSRSEPGRLDGDPFAVIFPARRLRVAAGLFGRMPAPTGPVGQRYGSDQPWPWERFA